LAEPAAIVHTVVEAKVTVLVALTVTFPVGVPAATGLAARVGVKVPAVSLPRVIEAGENPTVVVVAAGTTVRVWAEETEPAKFVSPL